MKILALDTSGVPTNWITLESAITQHATGNVAWEYGETKFVARGGYQKDGRQSIIETSSIIAIKAQGGRTFYKRRKVALNNFTLFGRDRHVCAYCGKEYKPHDLSREHIVPRSRGGLDVWTNVVTACRHCNCHKDDRLLSECGLELMYLPYEPCFNEMLILKERVILADQMDFLKSRLPKASRLL